MYDQVVLIFCWQLSKTFRIYSRYHWNLIPLNDYLVEYLLQGIFPPKQLWKSIVYGAVSETHSNEWSLRTTSDNDFLRFRDIHRSVELACIWKYVKSSRDIKNYIFIVKLMTDIPNITEGICVVCNWHFSDIFVHAVPHHRLITKLKDYGISGNILEWIKNFLLERKQKVVLNGSNSKWNEVTSGIPQWSVHGPILFTIYINDLPDVVQTVAKLFADDTVINTNDERKLQGDIDRLMQWL